MNRSRHSPGTSHQRMERLKYQRPARLHAIGKLFPLDQEDGHVRGHLFCLSLSFSSFSPLYRKCNSSPPLIRYKRGGRDQSDKAMKNSKKRRSKDQKNQATTTRTHSKPPPPPLKRLGTCSLSTYNPYYEYPGARQHKLQRNPLDVGPFMPKLVYCNTPGC
jgi:hypothetical protein